MTREEYKTMIDEKLKAVKQELMAEFKEEEPSLDEWKVRDAYFYNKQGSIIGTTVCYNDNKDDICDFDMFMIKHGYAKHTTEEVRFQMERDAVLYELSKYAEPEDREWNDSNNHWYICWNCRKGEIGFDFKYNCKHNDVYFASRGDAEKAIQAVGEERIKRFYLGVE